MKKSLFISPVICLLIVLLFAACTGCAENDVPSAKKNVKLKLSSTVFSLNTVINITAYNVSEKDSGKIRDLLDDAEVIFNRYDREMNPGNDSSALAGLNKLGAGTFHRIPAQLQGVLRQSMEVSAETGFTFDAAVYPLVEAWGFLDDGVAAVPDSLLLKQLVANTGMGNVVFRNDSLMFLTDEVKLGLGGIAKGAAVDSVARHFQEHGLLDYIVEAGGDLLTGPAGGKTIGIRHPRAAGLLLDTLHVAKVAVATSGDYERFFIKEGRRYCHIINPRTGSSDSDLISVTVITASAALSDAYATAVFVMGRKDGKKFLRERGLSGIVAFVDKGSGDVCREYVNIKGLYKK